MYNFTTSLHTARNLHALAKACYQNVYANPPDHLNPFESNEGNFDWVNVHGRVIDSNLQTIVYRRGNKWVICYGGIATVEEASRVYHGWRDPQTIPDIAGKVNGYAKRLYTQTNEFLNTLPDFGLATHVIFAGHSFGGAMANIMATRLRRWNAGVNIKLATFGSPRYGDALFQRQYELNEWVRVHQYGDIIPFLIAWFSENPAYFLTLPGRHIAAINAYVHMGNGVRIQRNQLMQFTETPAGIGYPLAMGSADIMIVLRTYTELHRIDSYMNTLFAMTAPGSLIPETPAGVFPNAQLEEPLRLHNAEVAAIEAFPDAPWPVNPVPGGNPGVPVPPPLPGPPAPPPPGLISGVRIFRIGRKWFVYSDDTMVYAATSKRDARGYAKALRAYAKQVWQNPAGVIDDGLLFPVLPNI
jgi:hypothetical protein